MTRQELIGAIETLAKGARKPMRHTHIECFCPDREHRRDDYDEGCFCPPCAKKAAVELGYPPTDTQPEAEGADDGPEWCETCDRLITLRSTPDLEWGITPAGALEELEHFESGLGFRRGEPKTPNDWQVFLLCVDSIEEEHLPRVEAVFHRASAVRAKPRRERRTR